MPRARARSREHPWVLGVDGLLYGTTVRGGEHDSGTIFRMTLTGQVTTLHSFPGGEGSGAPLSLGPDGALYGTTPFGGSGGGGTIFRLTPAGERITVHEFVREDEQIGSALPIDQLTVAPDGTLFGVTQHGFEYRPTVYRVTPSGTYTQLHSFAREPSGMIPSALTLDAAGRLYGTLSDGGLERAGSIFRIDPP